MKKIMIMIAAASLLVACGGNSEKKTDSANELKTEKKELTVEEQAKAYCEKLAAAEDEDEAVEIFMEMEEWMKTLSKEDQAKAEKAVQEWAEKQNSYDEEEYTYEEDFYVYDVEDCGEEIDVVYPEFEGDEEDCGEDIDVVYPEFEEDEEELWL